VKRNKKVGIMKIRMRTLSAAVVGSLLVLSAPAGALAVGVSVVAKATCTQGTNAMLSLSHDDGHVEAEVELHAGKAGEVWKVRFYNEGVRAHTATQRTTSSDGGGTLSVSRLLTNHSGTDVITATATNRVTSERCVVRAKI
jgi:hypothetical protein